ncbi:MAG: SMP-30/gluconolactonase/LRE family protein [Sulfuritalea sp.]|nr:SMP-30/gluconolactonase/LRE family protein [Sulfuritalea sp.]
MKPNPLRPARLLLAACGLVLTLPAIAADGIAYVSNQKGNVTTIDLRTFDTVGEIDIGGAAPRGLGVTADGKLLVVASRDKGDLAVVELATGKVVRRIPIGKNPEFVRVRGDQAFVSFEPASVGGPPPKPGSKEAAELKQKRADDKEQPARIAIVDLKAGKKTAEITGGMETEGIEFSADGDKIIVTNEDDNNLTVHDIASGKLLKAIDTKPYGNRPRGIKMAPDGKSYVATIEFGNKLVVLDAGFNVTKVVATGETPYGVAFSRDGSRLYVALAKGKTLQVFDVASWTSIAEYPIGERCWHFTFTPDDRHILVACGRSDDVVVLDAASGRIVKRIADKQMPWGIVTYPKSFGSLDTP